MSPHNEQKNKVNIENHLHTHHHQHINLPVDMWDSLLTRLDKMCALLKELRGHMNQHQKSLSNPKNQKNEN